jgi:DNA-binding transcriptional LysR family regulator
MEELCCGTLVVREAGSGSGQALEQSLRKAGIEPGCLTVAARLGSNEAVRQTVANGFGAAFLSETSIRRELSRGELVLVEVEGLTVERRLWVAVLRDRTLSPAAERFVRMLMSSDDH